MMNHGSAAHDSAKHDSTQIVLGGTHPRDGGGASTAARTQIVPSSTHPGCGDGDGDGGDDGDCVVSSCDVFCVLCLRFCVERLRRFRRHHTQQPNNTNKHHHQF